jgi:hypothetical protein
MKRKFKQREKLIKNSLRGDNGTASDGEDGLASARMAHHGEWICWIDLWRDGVDAIGAQGFGSQYCAHRCAIL